MPLGVELASSTRRWSTTRARRLHLGHHELAGRADHPRPGPVFPAPGAPGRLPFWKGDAPGRPLELGRAFGTFVREVGALRPAAARARLREAGLDEFAANNLLSYLAEQQAATARCPPTRPWCSSGSVTSSVTGVCACTVPWGLVSSAHGR